jgi:thiamine pyrophosphokinase
MDQKRCVIFSAYGGDGDPSPVKTLLREGDAIICADGGYALCLANGLRPDAVIGDFDSLSAEQAYEIEVADIEKIVHPREKDDTDLMLCIKYGLEKGFGQFLIVGGIGGDFGHTMANLQALSYLADFGCEAEIATDRERLLMVDGGAMSVRKDAKPAMPVSFDGQPGTRFSVLSWSERSLGVYINNAKYTLTDATLTQNHPIGVGNEFINEKPVTVSVKSGRLLIIIQY